MTVQHIVAKTGDKVEVIATVDNGSTNDACSALMMYLIKNGYNPSAKYWINGEHVEVLASFKFKLAYGRDWPDDTQM